MPKISSSKSKSASTPTLPSPKAKGGRKKIEVSPFVSTKEAAILLGYSEPTIRAFRNRDNCLYIEEGGRVHLPKLHKWIVEREKAELKIDLLAIQNSTSDGSKMNAKEHREQLETRSLSKKNILDDIKIQKELEMLLYKKEIHHKFSVLLSEIMSHLRPLGVNLGARLAVMKDPTACTRLIDEELDIILSDMTPKIAIEGRGEEDPFAQADREEAEALKEAEKEFEEDEIN